MMTAGSNPLCLCPRCTISATDGAHRSISHYKEMRETACRYMFWLAMFGIFTAVWSNELVQPTSCLFLSSKSIMRVLCALRRS